MTDKTTFDPDVLRKEFADYCTDFEPGIKAKAPRLNQLETLALIGMTLFQAAKELKAEKADQAEHIAELESSLKASRRAALEECRKAVHGEHLQDPTKESDDIAYDRAIEDCENAIRAISGATET